MRKLIYIIVATILLTACAGDGRERAALDAAQAVINDRPDSALAILDSLEPSSPGFSPANLRRWQLLRLMAQNKCDTVFRSDSLQLILTDYYDRHGTSNEKMWAYYLLGRAYYDMGEAPMAQRAFLDAVEKADTFAADCDYWNLCRVYIQLSNLHYQSMLPKEMLKTLNLSQVYAEKAGDTLSFFSAIGKKTMVYELTDNPDSVILCAEDAFRRFLLIRQKELACQYLSAAILPLVQKGDLKRASDCISLYEKNSGYFDGNNNIQEGREIYYYTKGLYYLKSEKPDSADWLFRKLLIHAKNTNDTHAAYLGLSKRFKKTGPADSLAKYAMLSEQYNDSLYLQRYRGDLLRSQQMFNYTRYLNASQKSALESERKSKIISITIIVSLALLLGLLLAYRKYKRTKLEELRDLDNKYRHVMESLAKAEEEIALLRSGGAELLSRKEAEISSLKEQVEGMKEKIGSLSLHDREALLGNNEAVLHFREKTVPHIPNDLPNESDWQRLMETTEKIIPLFHTFILNSKLSRQEMRVCLLTRLNFSNKEMTALLDTTKQSISNSKSKANTKLFDDRNADTLFPNLRSIQ